MTKSSWKDLGFILEQHDPSSGSSPSGCIRTKASRGADTVNLYKDLLSTKSPWEAGKHKKEQ